MHTRCSVLMKLPVVMQQQEFCLRGGCEGHVEFVSLVSAQETPRVCVTWPRH